MRVLFHAPPLVGHTLPMVPLAKAMLGLGHEVAWAAGFDLLLLLQRLGFEHGLAGPDRATAGVELARQWPERPHLSVEQVVRELGPRLFAGVIAPATLGDLLRWVDDWRPQLIVHDVMAHAAPLAAALRGLPSISHGFGLPRPSTSIAAAAARLRPLWEAHGLEMPADSGNHRGGHVDICPPSMRGDEPVPHGPRWMLSPTSGVRRREGPRAGVLASFGTVHHQQATFDALLRVLREGRWTARVALGRPVEDTDPNPPHLHVASWLDLPREWSRCQVGACHGGAGTMMGALAEGVPLLLLPVAADQFRNARGLRAVGAGLTLEGAEQTAAAMHESLRRLHDEPRFAEAARRMAHELAAMPQAPDVARALLA
jgi:UDP:flavonoid glycosyltransferase YjiC (YdhE family)